MCGIKHAVEPESYYCPVSQPPLCLQLLCSDPDPKTQSSFFMLVSPEANGFYNIINHQFLRCPS